MCRRACSAAQGDERAPQILESLLSDLAPPVRGFSSQWLLFNGIERLAGFYGQKQQHEKAAQTWLRLEPLLGEPNWMVPASILSAALAFEAGGQAADSRELLLKVPGFGVSWLPGLERFDLERALTIAAQIIQSREEMQQSVSLDRLNALALLGHAHLLAGDFNAARDASDGALKYLQALPEEQRSQLKNAQALARETLSEAGKRLQAP